MSASKQTLRSLTKRIADLEKELSETKRQLEERTTQRNQWRLMVVDTYGIIERLGGNIGDDSPAQMLDRLDEQIRALENPPADGHD